MNNAKNFLLMAIITSLLIIGTSVISMQAHASGHGEHKNLGDYKKSIKASNEIDKKGASQTLDQDNTCYRGGECQQANEGQQIVGKDNEAEGFNDQSAEFIPTPTITTTETGAGNSTGTTPTPKTCPECFRSILGPQQLDALDKVFEGDAILGTCNRGIPIAELQFREDNRLAGIDTDTVNALIACLKAAGIAFI
jgi:hypothetical protein